MNVADIVKAYLIERGYDGLCNETWGCECAVSELAACGLFGGDCEPGHRVSCDCCENDYHIVAGLRPTGQSGEA
jgi:hypothetical protein